MADVISFLQRNAWVVPVLLFIFGTSFTLYLRRRDKDSKHLDYQILADTPILTSRNRPTILKIMYGTMEVDNPFVTEVRFKNTGKQVIEADDFLAPMAILRRSAKVLDFNDVEQSEAQLIDSMESAPDAPDDNKPVLVKPNTLNAGDWFTVQVIYDCSAREIVTVTGRIKGQTRLPRTYKDREPGSWSKARSIILACSIDVLIFVFLASVYQPGGSDLQTFLTVALGLSCGVTFGIVATESPAEGRHRARLQD